MTLAYRLSKALHSTGICRTLILLTACIPACVSAGLPQSDRSAIADALTASVTEAAQRFDIPTRWIYAVIRTESAYRLRAVSPAGAQGLMQLMPATWETLRARYRLGTDVFDCHDNIIAGTAYLRELYDRYGAAGMLAAYNAGAGRYEDFRDHGRALPAETQRYVARLAPALADDGQAPHVMPASVPLSIVLPRASWTQAALFTARQTSAPKVPPIDGQAAPSLRSTNRQTAFSAENDALFVRVSSGTAQ